MCTSIKIDYSDGCVMGRTMDYEVPLRYNILYLPRNYHIANDLKNQPLYGKYKVMGMCFENRDPLKDGINEHGLIGVTNIFTGFNLFDGKLVEDKLNISSFHYLNYALTNYKTVEELLEDLQNIHMANKDIDGKDVIAPDFHFMFTDSTKRSIVIEPKKRRLLYFENPYDVMTNSPGFDSHVKRLKKEIDLDNLDEFNSSKSLPGGYDPVSRFIRAYYMVKTNEESLETKDAFSNLYSILGTMSLPNGFIRNKKYNEITYTRYICGYDTKNKLLTVKSNTNPKVYELSFDDIVEEDNRQAYYLDLEFNTDKLI